MTRFYAIFIIILATAFGAVALPTDHFAAHSVLADGRWVKISVPESGLYCITPAQLRSWGFSNPDAVRVHGYGSRRIPDALTADNFIDDLPQVQSFVTPKGIVFYAVGPEELSPSGIGFTVITSPYATAGYYFLTESDAAKRPFNQTGVPGATEPGSVFTEVCHHEVDRISPGEAGPLLVGEEFRLTPRRTFTFDTPDRVEDASVGLQCSFLAVTPSAPSYVNFSVNGETLPRVNTDMIPTMNAVSYNHAMMTTTSHVFTTTPGSRLQIEVQHSSPSSVVYEAWLNYLTVCYERHLRLPASGSLLFRSYKSELRLSGTDSSTELWDVTDPLNISRINFSSDGSWTSDYGGLRHYAAFSPSAVLPQPDFVQAVGNSDLHATPAGTDMLIIAPPVFRTAAERIAAIHRGEPDNMQVVVVDPAEIYNEFGSGAADVSAIRKYLKMVYDRGEEAEHPLRYVLLMGKMTYDNRRLTGDMQRSTAPVIPSWVNRNDAASLSDNTGFCTDDFIAMLLDGSGNNLGLDDLSVAVGRISAATAAEAETIVEKMERYINKSSRSTWKNVIVALADDGNGASHVTQTENFLNALLSQPSQQFLVDKVYVDAYPLVGGEAVQARTDMYRRLNEGALWWNYVGHATNHNWTEEGMLTYTDINSMLLRNVPFVYAATCNFMRWDSSIKSGGEIMHSEPNGGCIGMISATRPVYISDNGYFTTAIGRALGHRDESGQIRRVGDIYRVAKNNLLSSDGIRRSNENRLRYVLAGDPAMRLAMPSNIITIDSINGERFEADDQPTLAALQQAELTGYVHDASGTILADFNGTVLLELYDAEHSVETLGHGNDSIVSFETHGSKLLSVSAPVQEGRFRARLAMPSDISDNFRPATLNSYAYASDGSAEAVGVNRELYVYGIDIDAPVDKTPPSIDMFAINHNGFRSGDAVSRTSPMVLLSFSDDVGVNISSAGLGHQLTLLMDSTTTFSDLSLYYSPRTDGTPGGIVNYPLGDVSEGLHSLRVRVWDTSGNASEQTLEFFASADVAPQIFDLYSDANPASTSANFYITHDAPDAMATVTVTVYNMLGSPVWTRTVRGRSDMFTTVPVRWDLTDGTGRRVARGIYLYSAMMTVDGVTHRSAARKIAVTAY